MAITLPDMYIYPDDFSPLVNMLSGRNGQSAEQYMREMGPPQVLQDIFFIKNDICGPNWQPAFQEILRNESGAMHDTLRILSLVDMRLVDGGEIGAVYDHTAMVVGKAMILGAESPYTMANRVLSGSPLTPIHAYAHTLYGRGQPLTYPLESIGLKVTMNDVKGFEQAVLSAGVGTTPVDIRFTRDTLQDGVAQGLTLGTITMRAVGAIHKDASGAWIYDGVFRAFDDIYDANPSTHRDLTGEIATGVLDSIMGQSYSIKMPGEIPVTASGK